MDTKTHGQHVSDRPHLTQIEQVLSLSELCAHLQVPAQAIYDLRSQGRGPRGFRVGRELRFRISEVEAWLERLTLSGPSMMGRTGMPGASPPRS